MQKKYILLLCFLLLFPTITHAGTFGNTTIESNPDRWSNDYSVCNHWTSPSDLATTTSISFYFDTSGSPTDAVKLAIWDGITYNLIANSVSTGLSGTSNTWSTYTYTNPPVLSPNTDYCIGFIGTGVGGTWKYRETQSAGVHGFYYANNYASPTNMPSPSDAGIYQASEYVTYDIAGGGGQGTSSPATSTATTTISNIGDITFGLAIIITLMFMNFIAFVYFYVAKGIKKKNAWQK